MSYCFRGPAVWRGHFGGRRTQSSAERDSGNGQPGIPLNRGTAGVESCHETINKHNLARTRGAEPLSRCCGGGWMRRLSNTPAGESAETSAQRDRLTIRVVPAIRGFRMTQGAGIHRKGRGDDPIAHRIGIIEVTKSIATVKQKLPERSAFSSHSAIREAPTLEPEGVERSGLVQSEPVSGDGLCGISFQLVVSIRQVENLSHKDCHPLLNQAGSQHYGVRSSQARWTRSNRRLTSATVSRSRSQE